MWSFSSPSYKLPVILPGAILMNPCFLEQTRLHWYKTKQQTLVYWERLWCWEGLRAGGEGDDRGWDGWMASLTRWTWVWVNSRSWWWTGRPGVLRFMGSQRVGHDWMTELTDWLVSLLMRALIPSWRLHPYDLIASQRPHLQIACQNMWIWGKHSSAVMVSQNLLL